VSQSPRLALAEGRLSVSGDIGPGNVVDIRREGENLIAGHSGHIVVDLSGLGAAHSVVLSLLLCWARQARSCNQNLSVEGAPERLQSLAALSGLDHHLPGLSQS
jgi:phospholipid transport system transporter-binding protein